MRTLLTSLVVFAVAAGLSLTYPHALMSPGPLMPGHKALETDCLACHAPVRGVPNARCLGCHPIDRIGLGEKDGREARALATLHRVSVGTTRACAECHTDHAGDAPALRFSHDLLAASVRAKCEDCHRDLQPTNDFHRRAGDACANCHRTSGWKPATFEHKRFAAGVACNDCHAARRPGDTLHAGLTDCGSCHATTAWKPASFEHEKFFALTGDHRAPCATCHPAPRGLQAYTCFGCHEHTPGNIAREHEEEGIREYADCARCHRSGSEHESGEGERRREGGGRRGEDHDDD